jgi:hypothetical protein
LNTFKSSEEKLGLVRGVVKAVLNVFKNALVDS